MDEAEAQLWESGLPGSLYSSAADMVQPWASDFTCLGLSYCIRIMGTDNTFLRSGFETKPMAVFKAL